MNKKSVYLVQISMKWSSIRLGDGTFTLPDQKTGMVGFAPVFSTFEEAREKYPNAEIRKLTQLDTGDIIVPGTLGGQLVS